MYPTTVIEHLDVIDDLVASLLAGVVVAMPRPLPLEPTETPLRHGILQALSLATHPAHDARLAQLVPIPMTRLWRTTLGVMKQARHRMSPTHRHVSCLFDHPHLPPTAERPPHHLFGVSVPSHRPLPPAFLAPDGRQLAYPHLMGPAPIECSIDERGRHLIAVRPIGGLRFSPPATWHRHPHVRHPTTRLLPSDCRTLCLKRFGQARTAVARAGCRRHRSHARAQAKPVRADTRLWGLVRALITPSTDVEDLRPQAQGPPLARLIDEGVSPPDALAKH
jgi:hypothetical protein